MSTPITHNAGPRLSPDQVLMQTLAGAFQESVDLGPRGPQIRMLGQKLKTTVEMLRVELERLGMHQDLHGKPLNLRALTRLAQIAREYSST